MDLGILKKVFITDIKEGTRLRQDMGDMETLCWSITEFGLIHPIAVQSSNGLPPYKLVAGGRRLAACKSLGWKEVSCRIYDRELSDTELKAVELYENLHRKDLEFSEQVEMTRELNATFQQMYGTKASSHDTTGHSMRDTARMLGKSPASITQDIELANIIEKHPELGLQHLPNKTTALRTVARLKHALGNIAAIATKQKEIEENKIAKQLIDSYIVGDFLERSKNLPSGQYNLIECDPPYGADIQEVTLMGERSGGVPVGIYDTVAFNGLRGNDYTEFCNTVAKECFRLASDDAWIIWWFGITNYDITYNALSNAGWRGSPIPAIWYKGPATGPTMQPYYNLTNNYEPFFYMRKGNAALRLQGKPNVLYHERLQKDSKIHPMEKPPELLKQLFEIFTWNRGKVLCPFLGSGNTIFAAHSAGMECVGYDLSEEYRNSFCARVMEKYL